MNLSVNLDICRVCMKSKQCQQLLDDANLSKRWIFTTHLPLDKSDNLPKQLCEKCLVRLKVSYEFVSLAHRSDKNLRDFLVKVRKDFRQVTSTITNARTDDDEEVIDDVDAEDDLLLTLLENDNTQSKANQKSSVTVKPLTIQPHAKTATTTAIAKPKPREYENIELPKEANQTCDISLNPEISLDNVKNEQENYNDDIADTQVYFANTETETVPTDEDEEYQFYDVNLVDNVESLDCNYMTVEAEPSNSQCETTENAIEEENSHMSMYAEEEEGMEVTGLENQGLLQVDVVNQEGCADGFLKEYEGSLSDEDEQERIDYIEVESTEEMHLFDAADMQNDNIHDDKEDNNQSNNLLPKKEKLQTTNGNAKAKATRKTQSGRNGVTKTRAAIPASTRFICTKCNRDFSTKTNLTRHMATHEGVRPYKCNVCNKAFTQNGSLKQHMFTHTGEKPFVCVFCNRGFTQSKTLIFHLRRHTGQKPFHCDFCGLDFRQKDGLKTHILRHHMEQRYGSNENMCIICKKGMDTKKELQAHMLQHVNNHKSLDVAGDYQTGEQNAAVILELIDESELGNDTQLLAEELNLNLPSITTSTHVFDVVATSAAEPSRAKKYQCRRCYKCFAIKKNLIRHLSIHDMSPSELFQCDTCQIAFDTNYALKLHRVREHKETGINLNECEECQILFDNATELSEHMEEAHRHTCSECPDLNFKTQKQLMDHMLEHELNDNEEDLKAQSYNINRKEEIHFN